ncbi:MULTISPECIES: 3-deoxy-7-phosphoheptulonate synthase class II [Streptomyces]|uniref:Phospho-2-dehydro-3-deoxyheptonate aldolase n=1 Tax=Streptomyces ramulosus TaxID=47762 RepID=A0ABW1FH59_9ACTN
MITDPTGSPQSSQQPHWPDLATLNAVTGRLRTRPALVPFSETGRLRERLATAAAGKAFLLQGGHCAEMFGPDALRQVDGNVTVLRQMARIISYGSSLPAITVGRMAGQYAKPRSRPTEKRDGVELPAYRGDAVNGLGFTAPERTPDPRRMETAYDESAAVLDRIRALTARRGPSSGEGDGEFYVSHEALLLDYEGALVRTDSDTGRRYAGSGHMVWIGERTRQLNGAHVGFAAEVANPVAVKIGPEASADELVALIGLLDPNQEPGRLTFITRMGADRIHDALPTLVEKAAATGSPVLWVCDPMHGNTRIGDNGAKTRRLSDIEAEVRSFVEIHRALGTHPGGVHLELTGHYVTECVGGSEPVAVEDLGRRYESACDPRLNRSQALDLAYSVADLWGRGS